MSKSRKTTVPKLDNFLKEAGGLSGKAEIEIATAAQSKDGSSRELPNSGGVTTANSEEEPTSYLAGGRPSEKELLPYKDKKYDERQIVEMKEKIRAFYKDMEFGKELREANIWDLDIDGVYPDLTECSGPELDFILALIEYKLSNGTNSGFIIVIVSQLINAYEFCLTYAGLDVEGLKEALLLNKEFIRQIKILQIKYGVYYLEQMPIEIKMMITITHTTTMIMMANKIKRKQKEEALKKALNLEKNQSPAAIENETAKVTTVVQEENNVATSESVGGSQINTPAPGPASRMG